MDLVYKNEKMLFPIMLTVSLLGWLALFVGSLGTVLLWAPVVLIVYCFAQSALISYIKGNGVRIDGEQFPELKKQITRCCERLGLAPEPEAYLLQMGGAMNAFATRFFGRDFIVLYADVVDSLHDNPDALNFYIGHEIGHIKRSHLKWGKVLLPAMLLPLIGAAYSRSREYTCDRYGLAACTDPANAEQGLATLAAGSRYWRTLNRPAFAAQAQQAGGFWMSFHELVSDYPWLVKRMGAVRALAAGREVEHPPHHMGAALLAVFIPRLGGGAGAAGPLVTMAMIGAFAAIGIPAMQAYKDKVKVAASYATGRDATGKVGEYITAHHAPPKTLEQAGLADGQGVRLDAESGAISVAVKLQGRQEGLLSFVPSVDEKGRVSWRCAAESIGAEYLPDDCGG